MSEFPLFPTSPGPAMKALIIYDDVASAAQANTAIQRSARNANPNGHCTASPWRLEMLNFPTGAEEALTDALDAHLVVLAGRCAKSPPAWLHSWLEQWANGRQINEAALALFGVRHPNGFADRAIRKFSKVASRHGFNLVFDDGQNLEGGLPIVARSAVERWALPSASLQAILESQILHARLCWGINE